MSFKICLYCLLMLFGEALIIYSELEAARQRISVFIVGCAIISSLLLLFAYSQLMLLSGSIWTVSAMSILSVCVSEPLLIWILYKESPSLKSLIGFSLGVIGIIVLSLPDRS